MTAALQPLIGGKAWSTIQAHAALVGMVLAVVDGSDAHVIAIDRGGKSHRIDTIEQLEGVLLLVSHHYCARHQALQLDADGPTDLKRLLTALAAASDLSQRITF